MGGNVQLSGAKQTRIMSGGETDRDDNGYRIGRARLMIAELNFEGLAPEWIGADSCIRFVGFADGAPVTFFLAGEILPWLAEQDQISLNDVMALALFDQLRDSILTIAQHEWEKAEGLSRTFRIGLLHTEHE